MLFCCLWRNVVTCHKHFVVVSRHQHTPPLTTSDKCHNLPYGPTASCWSTPGCRSVDNRRWSHILVENRDFCLPHLDSTPQLERSPSEYRHDVWYGKTKMVWLPDSEKIGIYVYSFLTEYMNVTDGRTDTAWRHRAHLHSIAQQKCQIYEV